MEFKDKNPKRAEGVRLPGAEGVKISGLDEEERAMLESLERNFERLGKDLPGVIHEYRQQNPKMKLREIVRMLYGKAEERELLE